MGSFSWGGGLDTSTGEQVKFRINEERWYGAQVSDPHFVPGAPPERVRLPSILDDVDYEMLTEGIYPQLLGLPATHPPVDPKLTELLPVAEVSYRGHDPQQTDQPGTGSNSSLLYEISPQLVGVILPREKESYAKSMKRLLDSSRYGKT